MRPIRVITGNRCSCMLFSILLMMGGMVIMLSRLQILNTYGHFNNFGLESGDGVDFSAQNGLCQCVPPMVAPPVKNPKSIANSTLTDPNLPTIYIITPTYPRLEQIPELTRLGHTLMHVPKVHWIVADDTLNKSADVENVLRRTDVPYTYLVTPMPAKYRNKTAKPKGVSNRLAGIQWLQKHGRNNGVFYFADDDNTYDLRLFEEVYKGQVHMS